MFSISALYTEYFCSCSLCIDSSYPFFSSFLHFNIFFMTASMLLCLYYFSLLWYFDLVSHFFHSNISVRFRCFSCSLFGLTPWKQSDYCLYHLLQGTGLDQRVLCIGCWMEDREIWVIFLAWARDFSSPDTPGRLWRRPSPIQWVPGACVRDKGPGHWNLPNTHYHLFPVLKICAALSAHPLAHLCRGAHVNIGTKLPSVLRFGSHNFAYRIYLRFIWFCI
jgi:hypothetical protein